MRAFALTCLAACSTSSPHGGGSGPQLNDLSVLFPLEPTGELASYLAPDAQAVGGALLPEAIYNAGDSGIAYDSLRMVGFRLDPCFGQLGPITPTTQCDNQLRVVFQPLFGGGGSPVTAQDAGVHAFYSLTREQLLAALDELVAARLADGGDEDLGPLAPNFLITRDGVRGQYAKTLEHIVTRYAGGANLVQFTSLLAIEPIETPPGDSGGGGGLVGSSAFWTFQGTTVTGTTTTAMVVPTLADGATNVEISAGTDPLSASLSPITTSGDNVAVLASMTIAQMATADARQAAFDAALRIENPGFHSPNTIDCASCHMARPVLDLVAPSFQMSAAGNPNAFVADASIPAGDLLPRTAVVDGNGNLNIHAFSYNGTSPMINARVIHETANNLAYIRTIYGSGE